MNPNCSAQAIVFDRSSSDPTHPNRPDDFIRLPPLCSDDCLGKSSDQEKRATCFKIDPGEQQSVALCAGDPLLRAFVTGCWQSRDPSCISPGNESLRSGAARVELDPPQLRSALIGRSATLTDLSRQINGCSERQSNSGEQEETDKVHCLGPDEMGNGSR